MRPTWSRLLTASVACALTLAPLRAGLREDIGWTALAAELGSAMPTGAGVPVLQAEMAVGSAFAPDPANAAFAGKTFAYASWGLTAAPPSSHATTVAGTFFGTTAGIAPAVSTIHVHEAWHYVYESAKQRTTSAPLPATWRVENHSWIGESAMGAVDLLRRVDYRAVRDEVLTVSGLNNGSSTAVPTFFGHLYNGLVVGVSSGAHSRGGTILDGVGRSKPDLVAPAGATSYAAPAVAGAAALLLSEADRHAPLAEARHVEVLKAILLAGTTRDEFPSWTHTPERPLDAIHGTGELNIQRSHHILMAGRHPSSATNMPLGHGWDAGRTGAEDMTYVFEVAADGSEEFTVASTWNRTVTPAPDYSAWNATLANIDLELWNLDTTTLVAESRSTVDNVEFISIRSLAAGRYALIVTSNEPGTAYGLAWYSHSGAPHSPPAAPSGLTLGP